MDTWWQDATKEQTRWLNYETDPGCWAWGVDFPLGKNHKVTTGSTVCIFSIPSTNGNGQLCIPRVSRNILIQKTVLAWKLPSFENVYAVLLWFATFPRPIPSGVGGSVAEWSLISASYSKSGDLATCWICSRSSRVQIFGTLVNSLLVASCQLGFLIHYPVMLYLNYLFLSI